MVFAKGETYHVFNRSNANEQIFTKKKNITRILELVSFYRYEQDMRYSFFKRLSKENKETYQLNLSKKTPTVLILAYAIMPNHFHFLIKENSEKGIKNFVSNIQNSYAKYYNIKNKRFGALFQRPFKAKHVETDEQLLHLSRYIHLNPTTSYLMKYENLKSSDITSLPAYLNNGGDFIYKNIILGLAGSIRKYEKFLQDQIDYQRKLAKIKHLLIDK